MTSKNSFLTSLKENNKRRVWLWIVSGLLWFFYYPVCMVMLMGRKLEHNRIDGLTGAAAKQRLLEAAEGWLSPERATAAVIVAVAAVICAIQGFSYLYSRRKVDMYHSVPVKKSRRFAVIFTNGVLIYFIPYLLNLLLAVFVAGVGGGMDGYNFKLAAVSLLLHLILYIGVYGLTLIAVMMTGNVIITIFAAVIFLAYEAVVRMLLEGYESCYFSYYSSHSSNFTLYTSPLFCAGMAIEKIADAGKLLGKGLTSALPYLLGGILLAALFSGIAYYCYVKRPAEAAGKAMAFEKTKAVVKLLITVPFSLGVALMVDNVVVSGPAFMIFGMVLAVVLGNCVIEVIYEADIKAAFRKLHHILISGACTAAIASIFCFDLIGFDAWVPSPDKLEEAAFIFRSNYQSYLDENLEYVYIGDYILSKPGVKDVEAICELSGRKSEDEYAMWIDVAYRMKSGRVVWRCFPVSAMEEELLNRIIGSEEYKNMAYQGYADADYEFMKKMEIEEITFDNGFRVVNLAQKDADRIRELWKKDMENLSYTMLRDEFKCGTVEVEMETRRANNEYYTYTIFYDVYPSFSNLRGYLEEKGIDTENYVDVDGIDSITVTNYHREEAEKLYRERQEVESEAEAHLSVGRENFSVTKTFTEREQIEELAAAMYPSRLSERWKLSDAVSDEYNIVVNYKSGEIDSSVYRGSPNANLIAGRIPEWLGRETAYQ